MSERDIVELLKKYDKPYVPGEIHSSETNVLIKRNQRTAEKHLICDELLLECEFLNFSSVQKEFIHYLVDYFSVKFTRICPSDRVIESIFFPVSLIRLFTARFMLISSSAGNIEVVSSILFTDIAWGVRIKSPCVESTARRSVKDIGTESGRRAVISFK